MARPTQMIPVTSPLPGLQMVGEMNDWFSALKSSWAGSSPPPAIVDGMFWYDSGVVPPVLRVRISGAWKVAFPTLFRNANGDSIRSLDGKQICTSSLTVALDGPTDYVGRNWPQPFIGTPAGSWSVAGQPVSAENLTCLGNAFLSTNLTDWAWFNPGTGFPGSVINVYVTGIGRWF